MTTSHDHLYALVVVREAEIAPKAHLLEALRESAGLCSSFPLFGTLHSSSYEFAGQAQAAPSGDAPSAADKSASTSTMPAAEQVDQLEHFVRHFAALSPAEAQATLVRTFG